MTTAPVTDGRSARSLRTRSAVVDALLELLQGGNLRPTAREIASRAGVSLRSVYVHFDDLDDLFLTAARRQIELVSGLLVEVPTTGRLRDRADTMMRVRGRIYDQISAVRRAADVQRPFSPALAKYLDAVRDAARASLLRVFATELDRLDEPTRTARVAVLDVLTAAEAWDHLRLVDGMDAPTVRATIADHIVYLLEVHA
jgi:AcrR family transcriptional regulator